MMNIFKEITNKFENGDKIPLLTTGKYDTYVEVTSTRVNGILYNKSILFQISATNKKRITSTFIELTYKYYSENNNCFPNRDWYKNHDLLKHEDKSRPCNYAVAQGLINEIIKTPNTLTK
jgi:hypothetical protein